MAHLDLIASNIPVQPLLLALARQPELWDQYPFRTAFPGSPHAEAQDILFRYQDLRGMQSVEEAQGLIDVPETMAYPAWWLLPQGKGLALMLLNYMQGVRLGRVVVTKLAPGKSILPHRDSPAQTDYWTRLHVCLANNVSSWIAVGEQMEVMQPGEVWRLAHDQVHEVRNEGQEDRLTLICDIRIDPFPRMQP